MINIYPTLEKYCKDGINYPLMYGALAAEVRYYLRGDQTRDHLTAFFAQLDMFHSIYAESFATGISSDEASRKALAAMKAVETVKEASSRAVDHA